MSLKDESMISLNHYELAVVDDDRFYHGKMKEMLLSYFPNASVHCYFSGEEILKDDREYSFLIIDVLLDGENGIALSDSLKGKAPYIIYYSEAAETIRRAFGYNTIGFILKSDSDEYIKRQFEQYNGKYFSNSISLPFNGFSLFSQRFEQLRNLLICINIYTPDSASTAN